MPQDIGMLHTCSYHTNCCYLHVPLAVQELAERLV
jgi:hypothetical protein